MRLFVVWLAVSLVVGCVGAQRRRKERREERSQSSELRERTSKTRGVNGGQEYFDEKTGRFKRWPVDQKEPGEVVKRVKVTAGEEEGERRRVNKVLKRRKKYKKLPIRRQGEQTTLEDESEEEEGFPRLPPLRNSYTTSDRIRKLRNPPRHHDEEEEGERQVAKETRVRMSPSKQARSQSGNLLRLSKLQKVAPPQ